MAEDKKEIDFKSKKDSINKSKKEIQDACTEKINEVLKEFNCRLDVVGAFSNNVLSTKVVSIYNG